MSIYMLSIIYNDVRIRNGYLNYQGKSNGILFNPGSGDEKLITWQQLAETLIEKYGKKQKAVKLAPMPEPQKECPYYDANEVFLPDIARMINVFLENVYKGIMGPGNTRRFRAMGTEFAVVQRPKEDDFVFYDEQGEKVCYISRERMAAEYQKRIVPEDSVIEESDMSDSDNCERCENAAENKKIVDEKQQIIELIPDAWPPELKDIPVPSMIAMDDILQDAEEELKDYLSVADQGIPGRTILKHQLIAGGLRIIKNLVRDCLDDDIDDGKNTMEQLPLPVMRNNDQRKEWLRNYKDWGLWYTDEHIGVRYYKYDFANGARLIAEEYDRDTVHSQWVSEHTESYYMHLIGGPEPERKSGIPKWTQHGRYNKYPNSESELVEFLKEVQRESNCTGQK